jgi:Domain of unknown function (DUF4417)
MSTEQPLRLEYIDPEQLAENPLNWKAHPPEQLAGLDAFMTQVGWAGALTYNEQSQRLLDGHARRKLAMGKGPVPVLIGRWNEDQERQILALLDPTGWTSQADRTKLSALLSAPFPEIQNEELAKLMDAVKASSRLLDEPETEDSQEAETLEVTLALDSIWPTDNAWSVPCLLPELQADQVAAPVQTWGTVGARRPMSGTWHFYTADAKFEPLWRRPHRVLYSRPAAVVEPNFSTTDQSPFALSLWHIYRKRWLARYWQSQGLRVFVDLNVDAALNQPHEAVGGSRPNLLGVPAGWKAYASRAHSNQPDGLVREWEVARSHSGSDNPMFLVVGGGRAVKKLAVEHGWVWVPEQLQKAHESQEGGEE